MKPLGYFLRTLQVVGILVLILGTAGLTVWGIAAAGKYFFNDVAVGFFLSPFFIMIGLWVKDKGPVEIKYGRGRNRLGTASNETFHTVR